MSPARRTACGPGDPARRSKADQWEQQAPPVEPPPWTAWCTPQQPAAESRLARLVHTLHQDVIPQLVRAHPRPADASPPVQRPEAAPAGPTPTAEIDVDAFAALVLARDDIGIRRHLAALRGAGVHFDQLLLHLLAPTARHLGDLWTDDRVHFVDVTIALGRLQQIMRGLSSAFGTEVDPPASGRRALLMPAPGEQHTFGLSMVAEFFARAGWEVAGVTGPDPGDLQQKVSHEWFDLIGISAGTEARLEAIQQCIAAVRRHSHNRAVAVMVGGPLFALRPDLVAQVEADGWAQDAQQAPALAERLLAQRARGL